MRLNKNGSPLEGVQIEGFREALRNAFFERESFATFLRIQLNKRLDDLTPDRAYPQQLLNIADRADEEEWSAELLQGACLWRPTNFALATFAQQFGLLPIPPANKVFESKILPLHPEIDVSHWCAKLMELVPKICRIDFPFRNAFKLGTGFLLGKNLVMTTYHVMEEVFKGKADPTKVSLRFDYRVLEDGRTLHPGVVYHLPEKNWWQDMSEYSSLDGRVNDGQRLPDVDQLDYILLRLDGNPGLEAVGGFANKDPQQQQRGWIDLSSPPSIPESGTELFILHHPDGKSLKMTLNTSSVHSVNGNCTRIYHQTNTDNGTSGAPCFNVNWELVALHQTGDPAADQNHLAALNQSIPLATIWQRLQRQGLLHYLGACQQIDQEHTSSLLPAPSLPIEVAIAGSPTLPREALTSAQGSPSFYKQSLLESEEEPGNAYNPLPSPEEQTQPAPPNNEHLPLEQACTYVEKSHQSLHDAMALFANPQAYILPKRFDQAVDFLEEIYSNITILKTLLESEPSLLSSLKVHAGDMYHQFNTICTQIKHCLIPTFHQQVPGDFLQLKSALDKVKQYFSRKE